MKIRDLVRAASLAGFAVAMTAASARADVIYSTDGAGTGFNGTSNLSLASTSGTAATLSFLPNVNVLTGTPSNVNYGTFTLECGLCTTQSGGIGAGFSPFTFDLIITDQTDGATGRFVGTSSGTENLVYRGVSLITVSWVPLQLGPGTNNALTGDFGSTVFKINASTPIVAPNSGTVPGTSTVQGFVDSATATPEPATLAVVGAALFGLGVMGRKRIVRNR